MARERTVHKPFEVWLLSDFEGLIDMVVYCFLQSEEDRVLQEELAGCVKRLSEDDVSMYPEALRSLCSHIRASTTSMTSVPKPLKLMRPHYAAMKAAYEHMKQAGADEDTARTCADVISVLAMTMGEAGRRECLRYRLLSERVDAVGEWGHEYVRHLAGEIAAEWADTSEASDKELRQKLIQLAEHIVPYNMAHNAEAEACDLLMEIERLDLLDEYVDENVYPRVCLYLTRYEIDYISFAKSANLKTFLHVTRN